MKKTGKKVGTWIFMGVLLLSLVGCGALDGATKAFDTMMQALKSGEKEQVQAYYDMDAVLSELLAGNKAELEETILKTLKQMEYEVTAAEKINNDTVSIEAKITTLDFTEVMNRFVNQVMVLVSDEEYRNNVGNMSKEEYQGLLAQQMITVLNQTDIPTAQSTITVTMVKTNGKWQLQDGEDDFIDAIFANLAKAVSSLV